MVSLDANRIKKVTLLSWYLMFKLSLVKRSKPFKKFANVAKGY